MKLHAFALEHPDRPVWILWVQAPDGWFMLLAGAWPSVGIAEKVARGFGYSLVDAERGMLLVSRQMQDRPDLYAQQGEERLH